MAAALEAEDMLEEDRVLDEEDDMSLDEETLCACSVATGASVRNKSERIEMILCIEKEEKEKNTFRDARKSTP
jgi:hypothetical protein